MTMADDVPRIPFRMQKARLKAAKKGETVAQEIAAAGKPIKKYRTNNWNDATILRRMAGVSDNSSPFGRKPVKF